MSDFNILYCHCANANIVPEAVKNDVLSHLCEKNITFLAVSDLCGVCAKGHQFISSNISNHNELKVISCIKTPLKGYLILRE
jgi:hypothetical protein